MDSKLKITFVILFIILLSLISFVGIFVQDKNSMKNLIPDYQLGMDLGGYRSISVEVSNDKETIYYDKDGNVVKEEAEEGTSETVPVNSEEVLTKENYNKTKQIIERRLEDFVKSRQNIENTRSLDNFTTTEYLIRLNENDGSIIVQLPENSMTNLATQFLYVKGEFTVENEDGEVLLDKSNIKEAKVTYNSLATGATSVVISLEFNEDSLEKLKEITKTYSESTDEEGNDTSKVLYFKLDGSTISQGSFEEEAQGNTLYLQMGSSSDLEEIKSLVQQTSIITILINNDTLPIEYKLGPNRFVKSDLTMDDAIIPAIVIGCIFAIAFIVLIIKYRKNGLIALVSFVGYMAIYLIIIRYTNSVITIEGIAGILISALLNYIFLTYILDKLKKVEKDFMQYKIVYNKAVTTMMLILIPILIIGVVFSFGTWLPIYSFGPIIFWGVFIMYLYNASITRIILLNGIKDK